MALSSVVLTSCATKQPVINTPQAVQTVTEKDYTAGSVVYQKAVKPDSSLTPEAKDLQTDHLGDGSDVTVPDLLQTALIWGTQYNDLKDDYNTLKGWIQGVYAAQNAIIDANNEKKPENIKIVVDKPEQ